MSLAFGIILLLLVYYLFSLRAKQKRMVFFAPKYYRGKRQILVVGIGISLGMIYWLNLSPIDQGKLEIGRFLATVWADQSDVLPSQDNLLIKVSESGNKPAYVFLYPDPLLTNEELGKLTKKKPSCKPRPPKKPREARKISSKH